MSSKRHKGLLLMSFVIAIAFLFYLNLEDYQEQRLHLLINDILLSW
ncbi:hypothetical protein [Planctobacterium marinum]|nr:hypothetical protein [Planctobacterium marinum]MCC2607250.1 hypothetical protein [Planctobacterium marinum]